MARGGPGVAKRVGENDAIFGSVTETQVVEMLRKGHGVFNLVVISGRQVQQQLNAAQQPQG